MGCCVIPNKQKAELWRFSQKYSIKVEVDEFVKCQDLVNIRYIYKIERSLHIIPNK